MTTNFFSLISWKLRSIDCWCCNSMILSFMYIDWKIFVMLLKSSWDTLFVLYMLTYVWTFIFSDLSLTRYLFVSVTEISTCMQYLMTSIFMKHCFCRFFSFWKLSYWVLTKLKVLSTHTLSCAEMQLNYHFHYSLKLHQQSFYLLTIHTLILNLNSKSAERRNSS